MTPRRAGGRPQEHRPAHRRADCFAAGVRIGGDPVIDLDGSEKGVPGSDYTASRQ
ncbi:MAG: hypothetical protein OXE79_01500 [Acidimicrobiaceae bacterium]|nr:hypothetical protein [Acidimicrobiaceae bacterium]MCY4279463.1 hypothetical protein [Acidimicrobiaceae bacterium]